MFLRLEGRYQMGLIYTVQFLFLPIVLIQCQSAICDRSFSTVQQYVTPLHRLARCRPRTRSGPPLAKSGKPGRQAPADRNRQGDGRHPDQTRALWQDYNCVYTLHCTPLPRVVFTPVMTMRKR